MSIKARKRVNAAMRERRREQMERRRQAQPKTPEEWEQYRLNLLRYMMADEGTMLGLNGEDPAAALNRMFTKEQ